MRKNEIRLVKEKFKKNPHNMRSIENVMKVLFLLEDSIAAWNFLGVDILKIKDTFTSAQDLDLSHRLPETQTAIWKTFEKFAELKAQLTSQRTLLEAANSSPYGWHLAKYMDKEQLIFSENNTQNMKELREVEGYVRRDFKEYKARRGSASNVGRGRRGRGYTRWNSGPKATPAQLAQAIMSLQGNRGNVAGVSPQAVANRLSRGGKQLTCFGCGDTNHLIASCPKKS